MGRIKYVTAQGTIESTLGFVSFHPRRRNHRRNLAPIYFSQSVIGAVVKSRRQLREFILSPGPFVYDRFIFAALPTSGTMPRLQHLCLQKTKLPQLFVGYATDPERPGWGLRHRVSMSIGLFLGSLLPAMQYASDQGKGDSSNEDYRWIIVGHDELGREFRISEKQLMFNLDPEGSAAFLLDRKRDSLWRTISSLASEIMEDGSGSCYEEIEISESCSVSVTKMQEDQVRIEIVEGEGGNILQLDQVSLDLIELLPDRFWSLADLATNFTFLYMDDDEDEDD